MIKKKRVIGFIAGLFLLSFNQLILASDPPNRVIRLSYVTQDLSFSPAGEDFWVQAVPNRPLYLGDKLWAGTKAKAQLQLDGASLFVDNLSLVNIVNLNDRLAQFKLTQGRLNLYVRYLEPHQKYEIDTPNVALTVNQPGFYSIEVDKKRKSTVVHVVRGSADVWGIKATYKIKSGKSFRFYGNDLKYFERVHYSQDKFNLWCQNQIKRAEKSVSKRYVSRTIIGYEDLDSYGTWVYHKRYGRIWHPTLVAVDWAPYRFGHWSWIEPWGWTWVDNTPWGFAPYHYGRWISLESNWYWVPGPVRTRAVYAPALVAFVGNKNFSVKVAMGAKPTPAVAWFPLAPGEVYVPSYHVSENYFVNVNKSNTTINNTYVTNVYNNQTTINNISYQNQTAPKAITAISKEAFAKSENVAAQKLVIPQEQTFEAPIHQTASVTPVKNSVEREQKTLVQPPKESTSQSVVTLSEPPPMPVEFEKKQELSTKDKPLEEKIIEKQQSEKQENNKEPEMVAITPVQPAGPANAEPIEKGEPRLQTPTDKRAPGPMPIQKPAPELHGPQEKPEHPLFQETPPTPPKEEIPQEAPAVQANPEQVKPLPKPAPLPGESITPPEPERLMEVEPATRPKPLPPQEFEREVAPPPAQVEPSPHPRPMPPAESSPTPQPMPHAEPAPIPAPQPLAAPEPIPAPRQEPIHQPSQVETPAPMPAPSPTPVPKELKPDESAAPKIEKTGE